MRLTRTPLAGAHVLELDRADDERGGFARIYCARELAESGLDPRIVQCSLSWNHARGTLRGMHHQVAPHEEAKTVRVVAGAIFDVMIDLRSGETYRKWFGIELSAANGRAVYVPAGFAHGFITLEDATVVHYQMSTFYEPAASRGIRWDDPMIAIEWPLSPTCMSDRDRNLPYLTT